MAFHFGNYFLKFTEKMSEAEKALYSEELKTWKRFKQEVEEAKEKMQYYNMACFWSATWAVRQEVNRFFETIIKDEKLMQTKPHHKKFQKFMVEQFPCLNLYSNDNGWEFQINLQNAFFASINFLIASSVEIVGKSTGYSLYFSKAF